MSLTRKETQRRVTSVTEEIDGEEVTYDVIEIVEVEVELTPEEEAATLADWAVSDPNSLENLKLAKKALATDQFDRRFANGFAPTGTMAGETLQVATLTDRTNWLTSIGAYQVAIAAGQGAVEGATFRTTGNSNFTLTFNEGLQVLLAMIQWGRAMYQNLWSLKDAIEAAEDQAALSAINCRAGWPT